MKGRACWAFIPFRDSPEGKERPCIVLDVVESRAIVAYGTSTDRGPPQEKIPGPPARVAAAWRSPTHSGGLRNETCFYPDAVRAVDRDRLVMGQLLSPAVFQRIWILTESTRANLGMQLMALLNTATDPSGPKGSPSTE